MVFYWESCWREIFWGYSKFIERVNCFFDVRLWVIVFEWWCEFYSVIVEWVKKVDFMWCYSGIFVFSYGEGGLDVIDYKGKVMVFIVMWFVVME